MNEGVALAGFLRLEITVELEILDFAAETRGERTDVEGRYSGNAAAPLNDAGPSRFDGVAAGRKQPQTGDDNPPLRHWRASETLLVKAAISGLLPLASGIAFP